MLKSIYLFEIKYRLTRPATYVYVFIMFLFGFLLMANGGINTGEKVNFNASSTIALLAAIFSVFGSLISSAIMSVPVYRDVEHKTQNFLFAYPITEKNYLLGRFLGSFTILLLIPLGNFLGFWLGSLLGPVFGWEEANRFGPQVFANYAVPFLAISVFNYLITGTLFFALVAKTRNVFAAYMGSILLLVMYLVVINLMGNLDNRKWAIFLDPFYLNGLSDDGRYLTPFQKNTQIIGITSNLIINRAIYLGIAVLVFLGTFFSISFQHFFELRQKQKLKVDLKEVDKKINVFEIKINRSFGLAQQFNHLVSLTKIEFLSIVRDKFFWVMLVGGFVVLMVDNWTTQELYGTASTPATYYMLESKGFNFTIFIWVMLLFFTGEVVHRNKTLNFDQIFDSLPVPNWVTYFAKVKAISLIAVLLAFTVMFAGLLTQIAKGYFDINWGMYIKTVLFVFVPDHLMIVFLAFFVHVIVNNKFAGHFVGIAFWIAMLGIRIGFKTDFNLYFYGSIPSYTLSDFNGFGHYALPLLYFTVYWLLVGICLLVLGYFLWIRGTEQTWKTRFKAASLQLFANKQFVWLALPTLAAVSMGAFIYYNTSVLYKHIGYKEGLDNQAAFELTYKHYEKAKQPIYTSILLNAHLYPEQRALYALFDTEILNKTDEPIDTLFFMLQNFRMQFTYNGQVLPLTYVSNPYWSTNDNGANFSGYGGTRFVKIKLPKPLEPGEKARLAISDSTNIVGFANSDLTWRINQNGSFVDLIPPGFGYNAAFEIDSDQERKKRNLPEKPFDLPPHTDEDGVNKNLFNESAHLVDFEAIISTQIGQTAIAPGYLQKKWTEGDRAFFHYKSEEPIDLFYSLVSGNYALMLDSVKLSDKWVRLEIYHHPKHVRNLNFFMDGLKDALVYNSINFSPYQHGQLRIIEFPRYASFAQSFPNTIPFSEEFGWQADFSDPNAYNYAYYVTAHEVGHQWWGHQVLPSATRGSNLISESLAEYSAIMIAEKKYGAENLRKFLKYSLDSYLFGRASESKAENKYIDCNRPYQWYQKGSLIFYATKDYIGEEQLNLGLQNFLKQYSVDCPPYATSYDLFKYVEQQTPDSLKYFLEESWKKITLYDNRIVDAKAKKVTDNQYLVTLKVYTNKTYADSTGKESAGIYYNDRIDIGIFAKDTLNTAKRLVVVPLLLQKHTFSKAGEQQLTFTVNGVPEKAGIDPFNKLIDRIASDNQVKITIE